MYDRRFAVVIRESGEAYRTVVAASHLIFDNRTLAGNTNITLSFGPASFPSTLYRPPRHNRRRKRDNRHRYADNSREAGKPESRRRYVTNALFEHCLIVLSVLSHFVAGVPFYDP